MQYWTGARFLPKFTPPSVAGLGSEPEELNLDRAAEKERKGLLTKPRAWGAGGVAEVKGSGGAEARVGRSRSGAGVTRQDQANPDVGTAMLAVCSGVGLVRL